MIKVKGLLLNLLILFVLLFVSCDSTIDGDKLKIHIISVGLDYANSSASKLDCTINDASEVGFCFREIISHKGLDFTLDMMLQQGKTSFASINYPTASTILSKIKNLSLQSKDDLIIFYFSGHADKNGENVYLCCAPENNSGDITKLYLKDLMLALKNKDCASAVLLDACYTGAATDYEEEEQGLWKSFSSIFSENNIKNVSAISATASKNQKAFEGDYHSCFTEKLLSVLGWEHNHLDSTSGTNWEYSDSNGVVCTINGKQNVNKILGETTTEELYNLIMNGWDIGTQQPVITNTAYKIIVIPARGNLAYVPYTPVDFNATKYDITYLDQGGLPFSGKFTTTYPIKHTFGIATKLTKAVHSTNTSLVFDGWYTDINCTGKSITTLDAYAYTTNITLYAKWLYSENALDVTAGNVIPVGKITLTSNDNTVKFSITNISGPVPYKYIWYIDKVVVYIDDSTVTGNPLQDYEYTFVDNNVHTVMCILISKVDGLDVVSSVYERFRKNW